VALFSGKRDAKRSQSRRSRFIHSVLSFTRLEVPALEVFETAVAFPPDTDPVTAHRELAEQRFAWPEIGARFEALLVRATQRRRAEQAVGAEAELAAPPSGEGEVAKADLA
jgi:hypothetical protein